MCSNKSIFTPHPTVSLCLPVKENLRLTEVETEAKVCLQIKVLDKENPPPPLMGYRDRGEGLSSDKGS